MESKRVLVTGGLGYIGSHTVVELLAKGYDVVIADDLSNSRVEVLERIVEIANRQPAFFELDLVDSEAVNTLFNDQEFDSIIHFAALKAVGESVQNPLKYYRNNLVSLLNLLESSKDKVKSFIFSSSCTVYGEPDKLPVTEESPIKNAASPYGNTKQIGEEILSDYVKANPDFKTVCLRYFNPVGAHESAIIGELPLGVPANLVPYITQTAAGIRERLSVFGDDYNTPDGTCIRDYIHVVDLADAHIRALEYSSTMMEPFDVFNIGAGQGISVLQIIEAFERVNNIKLNFEIVERRPGDVEKIYADTEKANTVLNWSANRGIEEMMESAWKWQQTLKKEYADR